MTECLSRSLKNSANIPVLWLRKLKSSNILYCYFAHHIYVQGNCLQRMKISDLISQKVARQYLKNSTWAFHCAKEWISGLAVISLIPIYWYLHFIPRRKVINQCWCANFPHTGARKSWLEEMGSDKISGNIFISCKWYLLVILRR